MLNNYVRIFKDIFQVKSVRPLREAGLKMFKVEMYNKNCETFVRNEFQLWLYSQTNHSTLQ